MLNPTRHVPVAKVSKATHTFTIAGQSAAPGERAVLDLPVPNFYSANHALDLNVQVVNGRRPGPKLFVSAAIHGDELNGVEIIRRLLQQKSLSQLRGTLVAIPIVNVFGLIQHSRYLPDRRDLNRSFPGSDSGSLASRLADIFTKQIVSQCTHGIDLHTGSNHRTNLPQIRVDFDDPVAAELARVFGVPVILNSKQRDGSLRGSASELGVSTLLYEAGQALRFDELSIKAGVRGILSVMRHLDMLPKRKNSKLTAEPFVARSSYWERAPTSGLVQKMAPLGTYVSPNDVLGVVTDPANFIEQKQYELKAQYAGVVIGRTNLPLVNEGDAMFHVARFEAGQDAAAEVAAFTAEADPQPHYV